MYTRIRLRTLRISWSRTNKLPRRLHFRAIASCANFSHLFEDQRSENVRVHNFVHNYRYRVGFLTISLRCDCENLSANTVYILHICMSLQRFVLRQHNFENSEFLCVLQDCIFIVSYFYRS